MSVEIIRLSAFLGLIILLMAAEAVWPKRKRNFARAGRWVTNLSISVVNTLALRILGPVTAVSAALYAQSTGFGLFHHMSAPPWLFFGLGILLLDLSIYVQHVLVHKIPILWRIHRVHHVDRDIDVTTALRFHPIEFLLSMIYKALIVWLLGVPVAAVIAFEIILNGMAMFNHANLALPPWLDRVLRWFIVTPDMHRVHHSERRHETDSNFGFNLSIWDRIFSTYQAQPDKGHSGMTIGLSPHQSELPNRFVWSLLFPFR